QSIQTPSVLGVGSGPPELKHNTLALTDCAGGGSRRCHTAVRHSQREETSTTLREIL
ncbi:Hypothetical predicted protein, partial [Pelobates cultripes]